MKERKRASAGVERRTVLRGLATGFAGAVAVPASSTLASSTPSLVEGGQPSAEGGERAFPTILSEPELATLSSISELLVPGSVAAGVPELVDRVVAVDSAEARGAFLASLRAFEGEALASHASRWVELDRAAQDSILEQAASGARPVLNAHVLRLRETVARTYLATETGMRRLGWSGRSAWRELPACEHPRDDHR